MKSRLLNIVILVFALILNITVYSQKTVYSKDFTLEHSDTTTYITDNYKSVYSVTATSTNVSCYGLCNGTITVTLGGAPSYPVNLRLTVPMDIGGGFLTFNNLNAVDFPYTITGLCGAIGAYQVRAQDFSATTGTGTFIIDGRFKNGLSVVTAGATGALTLSYNS